jgi:hypothetical protein
MAPAGARVVQDISFAPDQDTLADSSGRWQLTVELSEGVNELTFRIADDKSTARTIQIEYRPGGAVGSDEPPSSEPGRASQPPPAPAAVPKPVAFSGSGTRKTKAFVMHSVARIDWSHTGTANFIVTLDDSSNNATAFLVNDIGRGKGTTFVYGGEDGARLHFDVIASGRWTLKVSFATPQAAALPRQYKGTTSMTTSPFRAQGDATVALAHRGSGNFIVTLIDAASGQTADFVANEIGKVSGSTELYGLDGVYAFDVTADGSWSIAIRQ